MEYIPTVVFDLDGVIHSYTSGWKGETVIPDPPVAGIGKVIDRLRERGYRVVVVSTRCASAEGLEAVKGYLVDNAILVDDVVAEKPPAICYIDDRAIRFNGSTVDLYEKIVSFKSWVEKKKDLENITSITIKNMTDEEKERILLKGIWGEGRKDGFRPCAATVYENGEKRTVTGRFHKWGSGYEEYETGPGNYSVAIIELDDGMVVECNPETVVFLDREG